MNAVIWKGKDVFEYGQFETPSIASNQVLIEVKAASICTTDFHYADFSCVPPIVPGHEIAGVVAEVGKDVKNIKVGDRVTLDPVQRCGKCHSCLTGIDHLCLNVRHLGDTDIPGGWGQFVAIDEQNAYKILDNLSFEQACLAEPTAVCLESFKRANFKEGGNVLIMGDGTFGFLHTMIAKILQAENIIVAGHYDERLERVKNKTNAIICNTHTENLEEIITEKLGDAPIDLAIEATGAGPCPEMALKQLRPRGTMILFSYVWKPEIMSLGHIHMKELNVLGACRSDNCYQQCIDWFSDGSLDIDSVIDIKAPLKDASQTIKELKQNKKNLFKAILLP